MSLKLSPGEQVIFQGHPSWRAVLGFYLQWAVISVVIAGIVAIVTGIVDDGINWFLVGVVLVAGIVLTVLGGFLKRITTTYTITDRRLNIKRGIIARKVQETRIQRVQNVNYNQGVYERIVQIGDVDFDTAGTDDSNFVFAGVAQPEQVVEQVDQATHIVTGLGGEAETTQH